MELAAEAAQRQVELGGEDQHGEAGGQAEVAFGELDPDRGGDQGDADHRQQLEDQGGEEADPQRLHRLLPVALAGGGDRARLRLGPAVRPQRLQAADHVEELSAEPRELAPAPARGALGEAADQDHEDGDQRRRDGEDRRRLPVARQRPGEDEDRRQRGEDRLRQVAGEVGLKRLHALHRGGRQLARALRLQRPRADEQQVADQARAQLGHHARRADPPGRLEPGVEQAAPD
ncbi:MAG TPA: hypothetical protein VF731_06435 [Solirubrobacterales bacterium]